MNLAWVEDRYNELSLHEISHNRKNIRGFVVTAGGVPDVYYWDAAGALIGPITHDTLEAAKTFLFWTVRMGLTKGIEFSGETG